MRAERSTFTLTTTDPAYAAPAFIGNGSFSLVGSPHGTSPALSFAAGVYDRAPGDVPRIAALPAWNEFDLSYGDGWLNESAADPKTLPSYRQSLDMYDGTLRTSYDWVDGWRRTSVDVVAFVSRADTRVAAVRLRVMPRQAGRLTLRFRLREWPPPDRLALGRLERWDPAWTMERAWYPGHMSVTDRDAFSLSARVDGGTTRVAIAQSVKESGPLHDPRREAEEISVDVSPGETLTFTKLVGVATSRDAPDPLRAARDAVANADARDYEALLAEHSTAWHRLWETDVVIEGDDDLQRLVHALLFYLLSSAREGSTDSIPPMGLSSAGYYGHVFWDADTWMLPALALLHPPLARSIVSFRARTLGPAQQNARGNGYAGAMYPWEADERGEETTPRFARQNALSEVHITADVALAQWQYYLATGDLDWLAREGYPVIKEAADFWVSRVTHDAGADRYDIRGVVSVDEDLIGVDNDAYTNAAARRSLEAAAAASRVLGHQPNPLWERIAARLHMPFRASGEHHDTYEGAAALSRGSVVPLLAYPLALPMSERAKRNDLANAVGRVDKVGAGAMMTVTLYAVVAAELGDRALVDRLLPQSYRGYLRGPFLALAETPTNEAVHFLTGAGGVLQQIVFGYTGLRLGEKGLYAAFPPLLPSQVRRLVLRNIWVRGRKHDVVVERDEVRFVTA